MTNHDNDQQIGQFLIESKLIVNEETKIKSN